MGKEITNVSVGVLKVHPRNTEFFDDISGREYEEFKHSIQEEGIISEIIVAPDMTIISGHQRYKAAKELGINMVPVRIREDLIDEDKKLKVLLAANFGRNKNNEKKQRKIAVEYVKLCGYKNGEIGKNHLQDSQNEKAEKMTLDDIAKQLGVSRASLTRSLSIERNLTPSMKELLDTGVISKTLAADMVSSLTEKEQEELVSNLDATKKYTQKQVKQYIDKIKQLESRKPEIIDKTDYSSISKMEKQIKELEAQKSMLERKLKLSQEDAERFNKLKSDIEFLTRKKNNLIRQIDSATELSGLTVSLQQMLEKELAPVKFKRCMEVLDTSDVCVENLSEIIKKIDAWSYEMKKLLKDRYDDIVDMP